MKKIIVVRLVFGKGVEIFPGDTVEAVLRGFDCPMKIDDKFALRELKEIASGTVVSELM